MTTPSFITAPEYTAGGPAVYFRRDFPVNSGLQRATLKVTALGIVVPRLNGARVGDEVLAPGWTSYTHRLHVSEHDVTDLVGRGRERARRRGRGGVGGRSADLGAEPGELR